MATEAKLPEAKAKAKKKESPMMIDWNEAASNLEAELKAKGWNSAMQRRNPRYVQGLVMRHIVRPLVKAIHHEKKG